MTRWFEIVDFVIVAMVVYLFAAWCFETLHIRPDVMMFGRRIIKITLFRWFEIRSLI